MAHVFISYAREDRDFVRRLDAALMERGRETWVDWDLEPAARFAGEIADRILEADGVVFVISPAALASDYCATEVEHADRNGKRIIPVILQPADPERAPPAIRERNWAISFSPGTDFGAELEKLQAALDRDLEWVRDHTDLQRRAAEWSDAGWPWSRLAHRDVLKAAERAIAGAAQKEPPVTADIAEWVHASRRSATRLRNGLVGVASVIAVALGGVAVYALDRRGEALRQRDIALMRALAARAPVEGADGQYERAALLARQAYLLSRGHADVTDTQVDAGLRAALAAPASHVLHEDVGTGGGAIEFSPDGSTLVAATSSGVVRTWDVRRPGTPPTVSGEPGPEWISVAVSADGRKIAGGPDGDIAVRTLGDDRAPPAVFRQGPTNLPAHLAFNATGDRLAMVFPTHAQLVRVYDLSRPGAAPLDLRHAGWLSCAAFSPDGHTLAVGGGFKDGRIWLWDLRDSARRPRALRGHRDAVGALAFSPNGRRLASGSFDHSLRLWDVTRSSERARVLARDLGGIETIDFDTEGRRLAAGGRDRRVRIWDLGRPRAQPRALAPHDDAVVSVAFSPDGRLVASQSVIGDVRVDPLDHVRPVAGVRPATLASMSGAVRAIAFHPGGRSLVFGTEEGVVYESPTTAPGSEPKSVASGGSVKWVGYVADGRVLATVREGEAEKVVELDPAGPEPTRRVQFRPQIAGTVAVSPDGRYAVLAGGGLRDGAVRVADLGNRPAEPRRLAGSADVLLAASAFSPESRMVAIPDLDGAVKIWDLRRPQAEPTALDMRGDEFARGVAFSGDGRRLVAGGTRGALHVWRTDALEREPVDLRDNPLGIYSVALDRTGSLVAAGRTHGQVSVWDLRTDPPTLTTYEAHAGEVTSLAFSPDGRLLASGGADGVDLRAPAPVLAELVCERVWRNLSPEEWGEFTGGSLGYERTCPKLRAGEPLG